MRKKGPSMGKLGRLKWTGLQAANLTYVTAPVDAWACDCTRAHVRARLQFLNWPDIQCTKKGKKGPAHVCRYLVHSSVSTGNISRVTARMPPFNLALVQFALRSPERWRWIPVDTLTRCLESTCLVREYNVR